jgi:hypothetical protein
MAKVLLNITRAKVMKETVNGIIARMGNNQKSFILQEIEDKWFGAYAVDQLQGAGLGDKVQFFYESVEKNDRVFNNIKGNVSVVGKTPPPIADALTPYLPRERLILRQNALTNAVNFVVNNPNSDTTAVAVLETAAEFEAWTSGDVDRPKPAVKADTEEAFEPTTEDWKEAAVKLKAAS